MEIEIHLLINLSTVRWGDHVLILYVAVQVFAIPKLMTHLHSGISVRYDVLTQSGIASTRTFGG